jgi:hypothetical protein
MSNEQQHAGCGALRPPSFIFLALSQIDSLLSILLRGWDSGISLPVIEDFTKPHIAFPPWLVTSSLPQG